MNLIDGPLTALAVLVPTISYPKHVSSSTRNSLNITIVTAVGTPAFPKAVDTSTLNIDTYVKRFVL